MLFSTTATFWRWLTRQPTSLIPLPRAAAPAEERRVCVRYATALNVRCVQVGGEAEAATEAEICDISHGGVQMISPRRFEPGSLLSVELPATDGADTMAMLAYVVHAQPHGDGEWKMGCRFSSELNEQQLSAFGTAGTALPTSDLRSWERFPCKAKALYQRVNGPVELPWSARVLNIAVGGMALLVREPVAVGELLSTEILDAKGLSVVIILACVVHTQTVREGQILGCNFIRELTAADMQALL